ncbi:hypothetical protein DFH07DRAFT_1032418 [Mycena maculata]|uniref:MYND-type domain-containing protein n=1 Tax=Mycena maculata TaxID=230809 RepID=A0AAD7IXR9_9AGAR|nr:hypothetical protein DFH07DRAFT_1032418 [Mycena maculata]
MLAPKFTFARLAVKIRVLKNCAWCRVTRYCSKKCQVSDWWAFEFVDIPPHVFYVSPGHSTSKPAPGGGASSTNINLKLAKKLMANDDLMFYLKVYSVLALDLLTAPANAIDTCLVVNLTTRDADPLSVLRAMMNQEERGPGISVMLQIASIEKRPLASQTTPAMRASFEKARVALAGTELGAWPVVMLVFTGDGTNCLSFPIPIDPEALRQGRELNPFKIRSALMCVCEVPVNEKNIIE